MSNLAEPRHGSHRDMTQTYGRELDSLLEQGVYKPLFLYHVLILMFLPLLGLLVPSSKGGFYVRRGVFVLCTFLTIDVFRTRRAAIAGNGYVIGSMTGWWLVWIATLLVFTDHEHDFRRIERKPTYLQRQNHCQRSDKAEMLCAASGAAGDNRLVANSTLSNSILKQLENKDRYVWQSYPEQISHRFRWCAGLLFSFRGPEWNWRAPSLGPVPRSVHAQLHSGFSSAIPQDSAYISGKVYTRALFLKFLRYYLILDFIKVLMMRDPYFRGTGSTESAPSLFPFSYLPAHILLVRFYHHFLGSVSLMVTLKLFASLSPICFLGLSFAFTNVTRKLTTTPLNEPWLYPDAFGPFSQVFDRGLAGAWGQWWHQFYRFGFTVTARKILSILPVSLGTNLLVRRVTHVVVAFFISGLLHAGGSHMQLANTCPLSGPFLFFLLQGIAIMAEQVFKWLLLPKLPLADAPQWLSRGTNFLFVFCCLVFSGGLIVDDAAKGGLLLIEPIPISPLRGLGLGQHGEGWWCWKGPWFRYWNDGTYWGSGIIVL